MPLSGAFPVSASRCSRPLLPCRHASALPHICCEQVLAYAAALPSPLPGVLYRHPIPPSGSVPSLPAALSRELRTRRVRSDVCETPRCAALFLRRQKKVPRRHHGLHDTRAAPCVLSVFLGRLVRVAPAHGLCQLLLYQACELRCDGAGIGLHKPALCCHNGVEHGLGAKRRHVHLFLGGKAASAAD